LPVSKIGGSVIVKDRCIQGRLNPADAKIGDTFAPVSYVVNSSLVREYSEVNGVSLPFLPSGPCVPPGMLASDVVWVASSFFDITGVILTGLEIKFERLTPDSGTLTLCDGKIEEIFIHNGEQFTISSLVTRDGQGNVICRSRITCVSKAPEHKVNL
jgi:hypothetical protein